MKKIMNKINFALIALMVSVPAFAAKSGASNTITIDGGMCELINRLHGIFSILRILAFVGAAFYIAGWAWKYISAGDAKMDDLKKQGIALLVGFGLLFMIGVLFSFVLSASGMKMMGCGDALTNW